MDADLVPYYYRVSKALNSICDYPYNGVDAPTETTVTIFILL